MAHLYCGLKLQYVFSICLFFSGLMSMKYAVIESLYQITVVSKHWWCPQVFIEGIQKEFLPFQASISP